MTKENILNIVNDAIDEGVLLFVENNKLGIKTTKGKRMSESLLENIKIHKEAIISFLENDLKEINKVSTAGQIIKKKASSYNKMIPLSFSQERLWFLDKFEGTTNYHLSSVLRITGNLDIELLSSCFKQTVNRHESLRTVFLEKEGVGYQ
ncbi:condensation domain-containing protein, partial [Ascidiimonas sp. W6]|uniref:condensation domain-containing protein n=1 Tax=Ascidiimonas meishanensis TaxID=3128903 RepID=UPI0030EE12A7